MMKFLYLKRGRTSSTDAYTSALDTRLRVSKKKGGQVVSAAMGFLHSTVDRQEWGKKSRKKGERKLQQRCWQLWYTRRRRRNPNIKKAPSSESQKMTTRVNIMSDSLYLRWTYIQSAKISKKICLAGRRRRTVCVRSAMDFSSKSAVSDRVWSRTFSRLLHAMYTRKTLRHNEWRDGWNGADIKIKNQEKERDGVSESMSNSSSGLTRHTHTRF